MSLNNLATLYQLQGKYAEAEPLYRDALKIQRETLGEKFTDTATSLNNLAALYRDQGRYAEAEPLYRDALKIKRKLLGEKHSDIAVSLNNLAVLYMSQAKYADAEPLYRDALNIRLEILGMKHPHTADSLNNLASLYQDQGKYAEAEPLFRDALMIRRAVLGAKHPDTAAAFKSLALLYQSQGKYAETEPLLLQSASSFEASRLVRAASLERSIGNVGSNPYLPLAAVWAHLGKPIQAFQAMESNLGRGLLDEQAARRGLMLNRDERKQQSEIADRLAAIEPRIGKLAGQQKLIAAEFKELNELLGERRRLDDDLADLGAALSRREVTGANIIQQALPADTAFLTWVDFNTRDGRVAEHWACVLRPDGEPHWVILAGSAPDGKWTGEDRQLAGRLRTELAGKASRQRVADLAGALYAQRIAPIEKHLKGVNRLCVAGINDMAGIPIDLLTDKYTISHVPSGTFLARLKDKPAPAGKSLLAVGDPIFRREPAGQKDDLLSGGSPNLAELPGTRVELNNLTKLFGNDATILVDSDASEQKLEEMREKGDLDRHRYLHFGTHGAANNAKAFESVLYLSRDKLPKEQISEPGKPVINGELSAREVLDYWKLDAELVTLSACETALGRQGGGDGLLGFAQAFLAAGARSVCLSLWKVDDTATALLMSRFYQNLLGRLEGQVRPPMPKAEALREAKEWLRNLSYDDARNLIGDMSRGVSRGNRDGVKLGLVEAPAKENKPFAHPRYWAAFILIGDPN